MVKNKFSFGYWILFFIILVIGIVGIVYFFMYNDLTLLVFDGILGLVFYFATYKEENGVVDGKD